MSVRAKGLTRLESLQLSSQAADDAVEALERVREIEKTIPKPAPVDPREGLGRGLLTAEQSVWARLSPRHRNRWPKLGEFDQRVAELDIRQATLVRELEQLQQRRSSVEQRHADALADWYTNSQQGQRPGTDANEVDEQLADAKGEHDAVDRLRAGELAAKVAYVKRNRKSLAKTAATEVQRTKATYEQQIDELAQARGALIDARATEVWAKAFPSESLTATPPVHALCGGMKGLSNRWFPALNSPLDAAPMFGLLKDDATFIAEVLSTEQKAAIRGVRPELLRDDVATWENSEEDLEQKKRDQLRARERHVAQWGRTPPEYKGG